MPLVMGDEPDEILWVFQMRADQLTVAVVDTVDRKPCSDRWWLLWTTAGRRNTGKVEKYLGLRGLPAGQDVGSEDNPGLWGCDHQQAGGVAPADSRNNM